MDNKNNNDKFKMAEKKRLNIYLNESILSKLDEYAHDFGINRSAMIGVIIKQYIDQQEVLKLGKVVDLQEELQDLISKTRGE